jgi:hypothetical protein
LPGKSRPAMLTRPARPAKRRLPLRIGGEVRLVAPEQVRLDLLLAGPREQPASPRRLIFWIAVRAACQSVAMGLGERTPHTTPRAPLGEFADAGFKRRSFSRCARYYRDMDGRWSTQIAAEARVAGPVAATRSSARAHVDSDSVRRAYARADFWDERVRMMGWWAERCEAMRRKG